MGYLGEYHEINGCLSEALVAKVFMLAMVTEFLAQTKQIGRSVEHPAILFEKVCSGAKLLVCPEEMVNDIPDIPGFCDSALFRPAGCAVLLHSIINLSTKSCLFEYGCAVLRLTVPLFEENLHYAHLAKLWGEQVQLYSQIMEKTSETERLLGVYYRVSLLGPVFGDDNGKMFVYRELKLSRLFDVSDRLKDVYGKLYGANKIQILPESGIIDPKLLNPNIGFIQITAVRPYFGKHEERYNVFECNANLREFYFETPFLKGETKLQGSVESQWIRRVILKTGDSMPYICKRQLVPVSGCLIKEYEPIRVACRLMKERVNKYVKVIEEKDTNSLPTLLKGSLLVEVNEGSTAFAVAFLGESVVRTKQTEKLRELYRQFLLLNEKGLDIHREFVKTEIAYEKLHEQLENGFKKLSAALGPYLK
jgi:hypothetical protein